VISETSSPIANCRNLNSRLNPQASPLRRCVVAYPREGGYPRRDHPFPARETLGLASPLVAPAQLGTRTSSSHPQSWSVSISPSYHPGLETLVSARGVAGSPWMHAEWSLVPEEALDPQCQRKPESGGRCTTDLEQSDVLPVSFPHAASLLTFAWRVAYRL